MELRRSWLRVALFATASLFLTACHNQDPPAALEAAVLAGDWDKIEPAAEAWARQNGFRHEASVLQGYTALARGDSAAAVRHFLRARAGGRNRGDTSWAETLAARYPERAVAHFLAGDALTRKGDRRAGLERLDKALALDPDLAVARVARGMLRAMIGEGSGRPSRS